MKNVLCFGDSNTYGYDPAGMRQAARGLAQDRAAALLADAVEGLR